MAVQCLISNLVMLLCISLVLFCQSKDASPIKQQQESSMEALMTSIKDAAFTPEHVKISASPNATCLTVHGSGRQSHSGCVAYVIRLHSDAKEDELMKALEIADSHEIVERITVRVSSHLDKVGTGNTIDKFLTHRLWWMVLNDFMARENIKAHELHANHSRTHIYLHRFGQTYNPYLKRLSMLQYPPAEACKDAPMVIGHMVNSGWGSHLSMYDSSIKGTPWGIWTIWDTNSNLATESTMYASAKDCHAKYGPNRRLCAFLPMTNCSVPDEVTKARGPEVKKLFSTDIESWSNATTSGRKTDKKRDIGKQPEGYFLNVSKHFAGNWQRVPGPGQALFHNGLAQPVNDGRKSPDMQRLMLIFNFMYRPNSYYRHMVEEHIHEFRHAQEPPFLANMDCTTIHIRRGDRTRADKNMTEFCKGMRRVEGNDCVNDKGEKFRCSSVEDLGCLRLNPFGAVSLQEYLTLAYSLHNVTNAFILTDDGPWVEDQKKNHIEPGWNVYTIPARDDKRSSASPQATENGVDFFASMALARQCSAFVGHWGSGVTHLTFHQMCHQHAGKIGICPLGADIGNKRRRI